MKKLNYDILEKNAIDQEKFLKAYFRNTYENRGKSNWFFNLDALDRDNFVKECIDKHNALSPGAIEAEDLKDQENVNKQLLEAVQYQNRLLSELLEKMKNGNT